jgi:hypothetical protein
MRRALGVVVTLVVLVAIGLGISVALHRRPSAGGPQPGGSGRDTTATADTGVAPVDIVPGPGQSFVTGTITSLTADNAIGPALTPPFTITIPSRGQGSADITGVVVGGQDVQIFWYGGQPLPVSGSGQLAIDGGGLAVDAAGITWQLDGPPRSLTGHLNLGAPVAMGSGGLATPRPSVAFDAGDRATVQTAGHAQVHLAPAALHVTGPGAVTIRGDLQIQTSTGTRQVKSAVFGRGSYDIDLTPTASGDTIRATMEGTLSSG